MTLKDQVKMAIHLCMESNGGCLKCPYDKNENGSIREREECIKALLEDFDMLVSDMENTIKLLEDADDSARID